MNDTQFAKKSLEGRVRSFYENINRGRGTDLFSALLGYESLYVNLGYWTPGCTTQDEACEAMAEEVAERAGITEGDQVLDAGCGYGGPAIHWARTRRPERIVALNVTPSQVAVAQQGVAELGLDKVIDLRLASATSMPFPDGSFDRVVALESSVHFHTRQGFIEEALRILRPGGTLTTADPVPREGMKTNAGGIMGRLDDWRRKKVIPDVNWYPPSVHAERLKRAGFVNVAVEDVTDRVMEPNAAYVRERCATLLKDPRFTRFKDRSVIKLHLKLTELRLATRGYVLSTAQKPSIS
ncbi:methyltransferase domain-containing protein [Streptomyces sp. NPDC047315]|uniref:SAM-dependent methyltransferase n=1 Tax=Streptomyces sp. NPDC047315 TaxID=3155142 RepID=UPI0033E1282F